MSCNGSIDIEKVISVWKKDSFELVHALRRH